MTFCDGFSLLDASVSFVSLELSDDFFVVRVSGFFGSSVLTVSVWTDGAVVFTADGNGSANELRMFVTAVFTADTTGALAVLMT